MSQNIHATACIAEGAIIGKDTVIGPYVVIEENVRIGERCKIQAHSVIQQYVAMGDENELHPHVVLGGLPQDTSFDGATESWLHIGSGNTFREGFTAHRSAKENGITEIASECFFMNNSHVAHDCRVGDKTIFANNVAIGGHVTVGNNVFMGGNVVAHQFCRVGAFAMVQGTTGLNMDVIPYTLIGGRPARHYRLNAVGMKRHGIVGERYRVISDAFRRLRKKQSLDGLPETEELQLLQAWLQSESKRGIHGFISVAGSD